MSPTEYRTIRKQLGLTQAGLAAILGETRETISRRERSAGFISLRDTWALRWLAEHMEQPGPKPNND
jgi:transcriptional regulator with XRE-family HTH domain